MTPEFVLDLGRRAIEVTLLLSLPLLGVSLAVGLLVSFFQAITQINEVTLTFVPKIAAVFLALAVFFPWMLQIMMAFTAQVLTGIPGAIR